MLEVLQQVKEKKAAKDKAVMDAKQMRTQCRIAEMNLMQS